MLPTIVQYFWLTGALCSVAALVYGGWCVLRFQFSASMANQRTVARLALHEGLPLIDSLAEVKSAALTHADPMEPSRIELRKAA